MRIRTSIFTSVLASSLLVPALAFAYTPVADEWSEMSSGWEAQPAEQPQSNGSRLELLDYDINGGGATAEMSGVSRNAAATGVENDSENVDEDSSDSDEDSLIAGHGMQLGMSFVGVPSGILGAWFEEHGNTWSNSVNMGFSLDYFLRFKRPCEMRFSLSWVNAKTGDAYWLQNAAENQPQLADYIVQNYNVISLEVAAYHIIPIIDEIAFYYGGGAWFGFTKGDAKAYAIRSSCANSSDDIQSCPHEPGSVKVEGIPPVIGFVMATVGFKFTLFDLMTIRAEGGFKGYFYGQLGLGVEF